MAKKMAQMFGIGTYPFVYKDCYSASTPVITKTDVQEFCEKLPYRDHLVTECSVYESTLAAAPKVAMHAPMPSNWKLRHEFVVLKLCSPSGDFVWMSLDKFPQGVLLQSGPKEIHVTKTCWSIEGQRDLPRSNAQFLALKMTELQSLTTKKTPILSDFLNYWHPNSTYNFFTANCQDFADGNSDNVSIALSKSTEVQFRLPGGGETRMVSITDDEQIGKAVQLMYPSLDKGDIVSIPELKEPFTLHTGVSSPQERVENEANLKKELENLSFKQKVHGGFIEALKELGGTSHNWRVIFSNLTQEMVLKSTNKRVAPSQRQRLVEFWKKAFDILALTPQRGGFLVRFQQEGESNATCEEHLNKQIKMLSQLSEVTDQPGKPSSKLKEKAFCTIRIKIDQSSRFKAEFEAKKNGTTLTTFEVGESDMISKLKEFLSSDKLANPHFGSEPEEESAKVKSLITKLVVLFLMENNYILLHNQLENQIWGQVAMFTEDQCNVIAHGRKSIREETPLQLLGKFV